MNKKLKSVLIFWDSGHRPDMEDFNNACAYIKTRPYFYDVDMQTDQDAVIVTNRKISQKKAQELCDEELNSDLE